MDGGRAYKTRGCLMVILLQVVIWLSLGGRRVRAQVHHVVGADRGWDTSSDVSSWSSNRVFRVGDFIWFTYSAAEESIVELRSRKEFESCDTSNPIRMYTDGLNKLTLDGEGTRYFTSGRLENCNKGLKLHVYVLPKPRPEDLTTTTTASLINIPVTDAAGPIPSASARLQLHGVSLSTLLWVGLPLLFYFLGL